MWLHKISTSTYWKQICHNRLDTRSMPIWDNSYQLIFYTIKRWIHAGKLHCTRFEKSNAYIHPWKLLKNPKLRNILNNHIAETLLLGGSLCTWVEKMNRTMTWGDLELINVISLMLNLNISILDYAGGKANIKRWHIGGHKSIKRKQMWCSFTMDLLISLEQVIFIINGDGMHFSALHSQTLSNSFWTI